MKFGFKPRLRGLPNRVARPWLILSACLAIVFLCALGAFRDEFIDVVRLSGTRQLVFTPPPYLYPDTKPASIAGFGNRGIYFAATLKFRIHDSNGYPNLLQTDDSNRGLRLELHGSTLALLITDPRAPNQLSAINMEDIRPGAWHTLELKALAGQYVTARIDDRPWSTLDDSASPFSANKIMIGRGFSPERIFHGEIRDATIIVRQARPLWLGRVAVYLARFLLVASLAVLALAAGQMTLRYILLLKEIPNPLLVLFAGLAIVLFAAFGALRNEFIDVARLFGAQQLVFTPAPYLYPDTRPASIGNFGSDEIYFAATLKFRVRDANGYPNLLQTDDGNRGIRLELHGSTLALLIKAPGAPDQLRVIYLEDIRPGIWHALELKALTGRYVSVRLDDRPWSTLDYSPAAGFSANNVVIGRGYSPERPFHGEIRHATVIVRQARPMRAAQLAFDLARILVIAFVALFLVLATRPMTRSAKQNLIGTVIVAGFVAAVICHYLNVFYFNLPYPYNTFLFRPDDRFMDWFNQGGWFDPYRPHPAFVSPYLPFMYALTSIVFLMGDWPSLWFVTLSFIVFFMAYLWRPLQAASVPGTIRNVLIFTFLSYPVLFTLDRANLEVWVFMFNASFLLFYRRKWYYAAATMLALSVACKPFGIVFAVLLLLDRRFLAACYSVSLAAALTVGSLLLFKGTFRGNLAGWLANLGAQQERYAIGDQGLAFGHSFFGMWKYVYLLWSPQTYGPESLLHLSDVYTYVGAVLLVGFCAFIFRRRKSVELWEIVALLVVAQVCLPAMSTDYTLLQCYLPMLLFIESDKRSRTDWAIALLFGLLMIPKQYYLLAGTEVGIGVFINPILLLSLAGIVMLRLVWSSAKERETEAGKPFWLIPPQERGRAIIPRRYVVVLAAITLAGGALLRAPLLNRQGLWVDELLSLAAATGHSEWAVLEGSSDPRDFIELPKPVPATFYRRYLKHDEPVAGPGRVLRALGFSTNPPLNVLLLYGWTRMVGTSDAAARSLSLLWWVAAFPLVWFIGREISGRETALMACVLFAFAPASLYYSTEARSYSLLWFFSLSSVWLSLILHRRRTGVLPFLLWVLSGAAGLLTHYYFAFVLAGCGSWLLLFPGRFDRRLIFLGGAFIAALVSPWYLQIPEIQARLKLMGVADWRAGFPGWPQELAGLAGLPWSFVSGNGYWGYSDWGAALAGICFATIALIALTLPFVVVEGVSAVRRLAPREYAMMLVRVAHISRRESNRLLLLILWIGVPCVGLVVFDGTMQTFVALIPRYALAAMPAAFLLAGLGLRRLRWSYRLPILGLILLAWSPNVSNILRNPARVDNPFLELGNLINQDARPHDVVIVDSSIPDGVLGIARYVAADTQIASWTEVLNKRRLPQDLEALIDGYQRVSFVKIHHMYPSRAPDPEPWLLINARRVDQVTGGTITPWQLAHFMPLKGDRFSFPKALSKNGNSGKK